MARIAWNKGIHKYQRICPVCKKEFIGTSSKSTHCSRACYAKDRKKRGPYIIGGERSTFSDKTDLVCPNCNKQFEISIYRLNKSVTHCCSHDCSSQYTAKQRAAKLRIRKYPFKCGVCKNCGKDILAYNSAWVKSNREYCSKTCRQIHQNQTRVVTDEDRKRASLNIKKLWSNGVMRKIVGSAEWREKVSEVNRGSKHWNWKGGITPITLQERSNLRLKEWRRLVFARDNYTCQSCGDRSRKDHPVTLNAHHIHRWNENPDMRYDVKNGLTLCYICHKKTDNYAGKGIHNPNIYKSISQWTLSGQYIKTWKNITTAAKENMILKTSIGNCLKGRTHSAGGYVWKYDDKFIYHEN